jgi:hypothetical protein
MCGTEDKFSAAPDLAPAGADSSALPEPGRNEPQEGPDLRDLNTGLSTEEIKKMTGKLDPAVLALLGLC